MTKELKEALDRELDAALESGDAKRIDRRPEMLFKATVDARA